MIIDSSTMESAEEEEMFEQESDEGNSELSDSEVSWFVDMLTLANYSKLKLTRVELITLPTMVKLFDLIDAK